MSKPTPPGEDFAFAVVPPTRVRYWILGVATLTAVLLYLERICIAVAEKSIREDLNLSNSDMAWVLGIFFWAYALAQVPSGWLSDRYGPRLMLTIYLFAWSAFSTAVAFVHTFAALMIVRFFFGLSQAGAYPTASVLIDRWSPAASRGTASSIVAFGGRFGGAGAPFLTALLMMFLTPWTGASPEISTKDFLKPAQAYAQFFLDENKQGLEPIRQRILQSFPAAARESGIAEAKRLRQALEEAKESDKAAKRGPSGPGAASAAVILPPERLTRFSDAINTAIHNPALTEGLDLSAANLPREAGWILAKSGSERSPAEVERMHRLMLETMLPGSVREYYGAGWRPALALYGLVGFLVVVVYWMIARDWPRKHPSCNVAEIALIEAGGKDRSAPKMIGSQPGALPLFASSANLWLSSLNQFLTNLGWAFLVTWMPKYLEEVFKTPIEERGLMTTIPLVMGGVGILLGGWLTDWMAKRFGVRWGRALPISLTRFLCALGFLLCPFMPNAWTVTLALTLVAFGTDLGSPAHWAFVQDVGGRRVGAVMGWTNMWGNFGAGLSPILIVMVQERFGWNSAFLVVAVGFVIAGFASLAINAAQPVEPSPPSPSTVFSTVRDRLVESAKPPVPSPAPDITPDPIEPPEPHLAGADGDDGEAEPESASASALHLSKPESEAVS